MLQYISLASSQPLRAQVLGPKAWESGLAGQILTSGYVSAIIINSYYHYE